MFIQTNLYVQFAKEVEGLAVVQRAQWRGSITARQEEVTPRNVRISEVYNVAAAFQGTGLVTRREGDQLERTGFEFLITDLETALTFCKIASDAGYNSEKKNRNQQNARRAYETVLRLAAKLRFTEEQNAQLNDKLRKLKKALENLGISELSAKGSTTHNSF